jgi:hypothetical protein
MQQKSIEEYVRKRGITRIVHFTPAQNLKSIAEENNLLNRQTLREYDDPGVVFPDAHRNDGADWAICCSIEWPNYKMLYKKQQESGQKFAIFILDPALLWELKCIFVPGNASRAEIKPTLPDLRKEKINKLTQLKRLFPEPDTRPVKYQHYPTDVQAEVLVDQEYIDLERYCRCIAFERLPEFHYAKQLPWAGVWCTLQPGLFRHRPDWTESMKVVVSSPF